MISNVQGEIIEIQQDSVVVMVGGIGLKIFVTSSTVASVKIGHTILLYTALIVREDSLTLFGFETKAECQYYDYILAVNGIGPKLALAVISNLSTDAIRRAVFNEQPELFARVPGIGKKNAQKIVLHLQGKFKPDDLELETIRPDSVDMQLMDALVTLGYSVVEAQTAVQNLPKDAPQDLEERLRLALQYFST